MPLRRGQPHGHADGRAAAAGLAEPAAGGGGADRRRREAVRLWLENGAALDEFRRELAEVRDLERTLGRLSRGSGNGRDLLALRQALEKIPALKRASARGWRRRRSRPG